MEFDLAVAYRIQYMHLSKRVHCWKDCKKFKINPMELDEKNQSIVLISNKIHYKMCFHVKLERLFSDDS